MAAAEDCGASLDDKNMSWKMSKTDKKTLLKDL